MKRLMYCSVLTILIALTGAQPVAAGEDGWGAFLDWINKLSGPRMYGGGLTGWVSPGNSEGVHLRGSVAWRTSGSSMAVSPAGSKVTMWSFQPTVEIKIAGPLWLGGGVAINKFGGDADSFTHKSFPVYAQLRLPLSSGVHATATGGVQYFPEFEAGDFAPLTVDVHRPGDGGEATWWLGASLEWIP